MCIRDRPTTAQGSGAGAVASGVKASSPGKSLRVSVFTMTSVSYTHLRAHATVLDLVCRLLLEKNQNHHYLNQTTDTSSQPNDIIIYYSQQTT